MSGLLAELAAHASIIGADFVQHIVLVGLSVLLGTCVALPLGIFLSRHPRSAEFVIAITGFLQTIPSLALLALMLPLLGIGTLPGIVALGLYALLPILRNTYVGMRGVDPVAQDCAIAMGMSSGQRLLRVELPMATPVILAGIRLSSVYIVSWAVLASLIGAGGLGNLIFEGLSTYDYGLIIAGAVPAALLAIAVGYFFGWADYVLTPSGLRRRAGEEEAA